MKMIISLTCVTVLVIFGFVAEEQQEKPSVNLKKVDTLVFNKIKVPDSELISELNTLKTNTSILKREVNSLLKIKKTTDTTVIDSLSEQVKRKKFIPRLIDKIK